MIYISGVAERGVLRTSAHFLHPFSHTNNVFKKVAFFGISPQL